MIRRREGSKVAALPDVEREIPRRAKGHDEVDVRVGFLRRRGRVSMFGLLRERTTYQAVFELDNVAVSDPLEDGDLGLEVLEQLGGELAPDDRLDGYRSVCIL